MHTPKEQIVKCLYGARWYSNPTGHSAMMDTFGVCGKVIDGQAAVIAAKIDELYGLIFGEKKA
jgi:hypothetical protein